MVHHVEFMDVADSDFLGHNRELDDDDSEFETVFEKYFVFSAAKNHIFARKLPLHVVLGSGIVADIILWRKKRITASILSGVTVIWFIFKRMEYTLLSFICDSLIILLAMLFLWTHLTSFIDISPPKLSAFVLPEGFLVNTAISMTRKLNRQLVTFRLLASGQDFKKFLWVTWTLGVVSVLGNWFAASTIFYIGQLATYSTIKLQTRFGFCAVSETTFATVERSMSLNQNLNLIQRNCDIDDSASSV